MIIGIDNLSYSTKWKADDQTYEGRKGGKVALFDDEEGNQQWQPSTKRQTSRTRLTQYPTTYRFAFPILLPLYLTLCRQGHPMSR